MRLRSLHSIRVHNNAHADFLNRLTRSFLLCCGAIVAAVGAVSSLAASPDPCASQIRGTPELTEYGYKQRGSEVTLDQRCEGVFDHDDSAGDVIAVQSLTLGAISFDMDGLSVIEVTIPALVAGDIPSITVRAAAKALPFSYQMDANIASGKVLQWPTADVLYPKTIPATNLGVSGWTGKDELRLFIPIKARQRSMQTSKGDLILVSLVSPHRLFQLRWRAGEEQIENGSRVCRDGSGWSFVDDPPSGFPIDLQIIPTRAPVLCLEVGVKRNSSSVWKSETIRIATPH